MALHAGARVEEEARVAGGACGGAGATAGRASWIALHARARVKVKPSVTGKASALITGRAPRAARNTHGAHLGRIEVKFGLAGGAAVVSTAREAALGADGTDANAVGAGALKKQSNDT